MRIKEFLINRYGPIGTGTVVRLGDFNLLFGRNEAGKSLTIDALVKFLLGKKVKEFEKLDRVGEEPAGYVIIEQSGGTEIKLPGSDRVEEFEGLGNADFRNIFVARDSDLSLNSESGYYTSVSNKLTGLHTDKIKNIREKLNRIGQITNSGLFRNDEDSGKLKDRIEKAEGFIDDIGHILEELEEAGFDRMESDAASCESSIEGLKLRKRALEKARMRDQYEKAAAALEGYKKAEDRLKEFAVYREEDEREWSDKKGLLERKREEEKEQSEKLKELEGEKKEITRELETAGEEHRKMQRGKDQLDEGIKFELKGCRTLSEELAGRKNESSYWANLASVSSMLFGLSIILLIFYRSYISVSISLVLAISTVLLWIKRYRPVKNKAALGKKIEQARFSLAEIGIGGTDVEEMLQSVRKFEDRYSGLQNRISGMKLQIRNIEGNIAEIRETVIPGIRKAAESAAERIDEIRAESGAETLDQFRAGLAQKRAAEKRRSEEGKVLESLLGEAGESERFAYWERETEKLKKYSQGGAAGASYSRAEAEEIDNNIERMDRELKEKKLEISVIREKLQEIGISANTILPQAEGEKIYCSSIVELKAIEAELGRFIDKKVNNRDTVQKAIEIFGEIDDEEREKVAELFGPGEKVSEYFSSVTGGTYAEVNFDHSDETVRVVDIEGRSIPAEKLSGGTYDQLYFSIRLALGESLLKGRKGFLILDDPFIKADTGRLMRQLELLRKISAAGWQVIYFSAKDEVREALDAGVKAEEVNFIQMGRQ